MTPLRAKIECENCHRYFIVTYDADNPTKLLSVDCVCGHSTAMKEVPPPRMRASHGAGGNT